MKPLCMIAEIDEFVDLLDLRPQAKLAVDAEAVRRAAFLLKWCADCLRARGSSDDLAAFPYVPEMEELSVALLSAQAVAGSADFTREVCEALFGCFVEGDRYYPNCALCQIHIDPARWTTAPHEPDCIINRVREYLFSVVPEAERERVLGNWQPNSTGERARL